MERQPFSSRREDRGRFEQLSDEALIEAIAGGEMKALEQLHKRHYSKLERFAMRLAESGDAAEEVVNDTLMTVWRTADRFEGRSKPTTWMFGIAYRMAMKARQKAARRKGDVELDENLVADGTGTADQVIMRTDLAAALKGLTPDLRAVVELTYFNGFLYTEIAAILECPVGTVKTRMMTARKRLREVLEDGETSGKDRSIV